MMTVLIPNGGVPSRPFPNVIDDLSPPRFNGARVSCFARDFRADVTDSHVSVFSAKRFSSVIVPGDFHYPFSPFWP